MSDLPGPVRTSGGVSPGSAVKRLVLIPASRVVKCIFNFRKANQLLEPLAKRIPIQSKNGDVSCCLVCGETAAAGNPVDACKYCTEFFTVSVESRLAYECNFGGSCKTDKYTRKQCKFCWLKKCYLKGMELDFGLVFVNLNSSDTSRNVLEEREMEQQIAAKKYMRNPQHVPALQSEFEHVTVTDTTAERMKEKTDQVQESSSEDSFDDSDEDPDFNDSNISESSSETDSDHESEMADRRTENLAKAIPLLVTEPSSAPPLYVAELEESEQHLGEPSPSMFDQVITDTEQQAVQPDPTGSKENTQAGDKETFSKNSNVGGKIKTKCEICSREFINLGAYVNHSKTCRKDFQCLKCGKKMKNLKCLKSHVKSQHFSEPKFVCETCQLKFRTSSRLKSHEKIHNDSKVACPVCNKTFKSKNVLKVHKSRKHTKFVKTKKKWPCQLCPKVYDSDRGLRSHIRNHKLAALEDTAEESEVERRVESGAALIEEVESGAALIEEVETTVVPVEENGTFAFVDEEELVHLSYVICDGQVDNILM